MTEKEKMKKAMWYDANNDTKLLNERLKAEGLCFDYNNTHPSNETTKRKILKELLPNIGENITILSSLYVDYGYNCYIGDNTFINHNVYLMDGAKISIGTNCFIGPNCGIYTAMHPLNAKERNSGLEKALPVIIGNDVWIGADVTILPGVKIGNGSVIGAMSLVNIDIPENVVAVGNPCRIIKDIDQNKSSLVD